MPLLRKDDTLTAWTEVRGTAEQVYAVVSDITRIPQWSPETIRARWVGDDRFEAWNRRRLGRWRTTAHVITAKPNREFSFVVQAFGGDWTHWRYLIEPGATESTTRLSESMRMCVALPMAAAIYEHLCLFVHDRRSDLQDNLEHSVERIRTLVEAGAA
ncbi:SRPBCC family protein [Mycobacterium sp. TNTM28]|uniref:SRPBCC family protein n=1 Tax=[Mycobacterium] fortunisiensis TaxID=2600579 RepID=A0ABS6KKT8_9MYCO|nr:SRPBCC family protein [[Mycobacterium] fortunisiensis]MBU9764220.1 SRPBCC family protein [[Mycobacterium] fortunisiensis]